MRAHVIDFPMKQVTQSVTLKVRIRGRRSFKFRMWVGTRLLVLAAWVIGTQISIDLDKIAG